VNPHAATLCASLDLHAELLESLVEASQGQLRALIGYRGDVRGGGEALELAHTEVRALSERLEASSAALASEVLAAARDLGIPEASEPGISDLADRLPTAAGDALRERVSAVRSLAQALTELQQLNQVHARRGLQLVSAWRALMTGDTSGGLETYSHPGRPRQKSRTSASTLELSI